MAKIKFKTDAGGDFAERGSFKIAKTDYFDPTGTNEAFVKLLSPQWRESESPDTDDQ